jgi:hypothetical protein
MKTIYFSNGVPGVDDDSPDQPVQGLTLVHFSMAKDGSWVAVQRDTDGEPYFGYKATKLSQEEAEVWQERIARAGQADEGGYSDSAGTWYPGRIGAGRSVIDAAGWKLLRARAAKAAEAATAAQQKALTPVYKMAEAVAKATGQPAVEILKAFRPDLSDQTLAALESKAALR